MELLILLIVLLAVDVAACRWGVDSRDGKDWRPGPMPPMRSEPNALR